VTTSKFAPRIDTQLSVFMENKPGRLAQICSTLGQQNVNIFCMSIHDTVDHSIIRFIVDNATKALILLEEEGLYIVTQKVVVVTIDNRPGCLAEIARKLAVADQNIEYAYCTAGPLQDSGILVLKTEDAEQTLEVLQDSA
jgi:hypothetical protein